MGDVSAHLAQLQSVIDAQWPRALAGDPEAAQAVQTAQLRQARILGVTHD